MRYCNYHQHTGYSFLDGMAKPSDLVSRCKELGFDYCMVTDHGNVAGSAAVYRECRKQGVTPLIGTELYLRDDRYDNGKKKGWHLLLWALNTEGLKNVWTISSRTFMATDHDHKTANATWDMFEGCGEGVVCSSACLASMLSDAARKNDEAEADYFIERCNNYFQEFAVELHCNHEEGQHEVNLWLADYARRRGLRTVYSVDAHYVTREDAELHDLWLGLNKGYADIPHWTMKHQYYVKSPEEIRHDLSYLGENAVDRAFEGVDELLGMVGDIDLDGTHKVASAPLPEGYDDPDRYLRDLAYSRLFERFAKVSVQIDGDRIVVPLLDIPEELLGDVSTRVTRLGEELSIVLDNGLSDYFLMVSEYASWAKSSGILLGPGRGSGAGSLLCYLLDITSIDPLEHDLMFSRFINQGRLGTYVVTWDDGSETEFGEKVVVQLEGGPSPLSEVKSGDVIVGRLQPVTSRAIRFEPRTVADVTFRGGELPDIDLDFEGRRRPEVEQHLRDVYGEDHVTAVGTTTFYGISLALQDVCRYYRIPLSETTAITKSVRELEELAGKNGNWRDHMDMIRPADAKRIRDIEERYPSLFPQAEAIVGLPRQQGKHAAGYVVSPEPLAESLPVRKAFPSKEEADVISQFDKYEVEDLGFVKIDVLGLRNLDTLAAAIRSVRERTGETIDPYSIGDDPDDPLWDALGDGDTFSVFQLEGQGVTDVVKALRPRSVDDLAIIQALYRPGVIGAGMLDEYVKRATGTAPVSYLHPLLKPILAETFGIIVFQEQAMRCFTDLAGFTETEADQIRAAIGHKNKAQMDAMRPRWNEGCERNGINIQTADRIWEQIQASAGYSFNRCLTGDTMVHRSNRNPRDVAFPDCDITVEELFKRFHSKTKLGWRYRKHGVRILCMDSDGRARAHRIVDVFDNGLAEVFQIVLSDGKSVRATSNHRFLTDSGYRQVSELSVGDSLVICDFIHDKYKDNLAMRMTSGPLHTGKNVVRGTDGRFEKGSSENYVDGGYAAFQQFREGADPVCADCGADLSGKRFEVHHIDGNRKHNTKDNLVVLCPSCHKNRHVALGRVERGQRGYSTSTAEIVSIEPCGVDHVYDIEIDSDEHNFFANGICSHNSHAVCYSTISYWMAWMRQHYPVDYYAACLSTVGDAKTPGYVNRARKDGVKVLPPTVASPSRDYIVTSDTEIAMGLINVKGLGEKTIRNIVDNAPYSDFRDFCARSGTNKAGVEQLIKGNFFREFEPNSLALLCEYEVMRDPKQAPLFDDLQSNFESRWYSESEVIENERSIYGVSLTYDEWENHRRNLPDGIEVMTSDGIEAMHDGDLGLVLCRITQTRTHTDKNGNVMCFVGFDTDENMSMDATAFASLWSKVSDDMREGAVYLLQVKRGTYRGNPSFTIENVMRLDRR